MKETPALSDFTVTEAKRGAFRYLYHRPKCSKVNPANVVEVGALTAGAPIEPAGCCTPPMYDFAGAITAEAEQVKACPSCGRADVVRNGLVGAHACEGLKRGKAKAGGAGRGRPVGQTVTFTVNGRPMVRARRWTLGYMAAECTKGLGKGGGLMGTDDLRKLLAKAGVTEPETTEWEVELPNGVTVGATLGSQGAKAKAS